MSYDRMEIMQRAYSSLILNQSTIFFVQAMLAFIKTEGLNKELKLNIAMLVPVTLRVWHFV